MLPSVKNNQNVPLYQGSCDEAAVASSGCGDYMLTMSPHLRKIPPCAQAVIMCRCH